MPRPVSVKFQPDHLDGVNAISSRDSNRLAINGQVWTSSIIVPWRGEVVAWPCRRHEDVQAEHLDALLAWQPEVVIYGSGPSLRFMPPALMRTLMAHRIGLESMDTAAACRTYNILVNEGRRVLGALLLG